MGIFGLLAHIDAAEHRAADAHMIARQQLERVAAFDRKPVGVGEREVGDAVDAVVEEVVSTLPPVSRSLPAMRLYPFPTSGVCDAVARSTETDQARMKPERRLFRFSIVYLFAVFGVLIVDRALLP